MEHSSRMDQELNGIFEGEQKEKIKTEFQRIKDYCYLDHTGCAPYPKSLLDQTFKDLSENVYSNPHSNSTTSKESLDSIDQVRFRILEHFNTNSIDYSVIFTSGATAALKLVAESFLWANIPNENEWYPKNSSQNGGDFVYMEDNHTSVLGMRDIIEKKGIKTYCLEHGDAIDIFNEEKPKKSTKIEYNSLFVYSAQCNFSGVKYPLEWIKKVENLNLKTQKKSNWYCMLDAATFASTNFLDLSHHKADFVCISFYKMFGFPTGLGALLVKNKSASVLEKSYYGGGTVSIALSTENRFVPRPILHEQFEDGSLNFLSIVSLNHGFSTLKNLVGNMDNISNHCFNLAKYAFYSLLQLHHSNGHPAVYVYADTAYDDVTTQGNIVNFNMLRQSGDFVGFAEVLNMANLHDIQLRTGCFCNPGACRRHLGLNSEDVKKHYQAGHVCGDDRDLVEGQPTGSVRVSFGYYNTTEDVDRLVHVLRKCFVKEPAVIKMPLMWHSTLFYLKNKFKTNEQKFRPVQNLDAMKYIYFLHENNYLPPNFDQYTQSELTTSRTTSEVYISHIFVYPIKSCGRFFVKKWELDSKGLKYDRQWMITNSSGVALTQKREPRLCLIRPCIDTELNKLVLTCQGFENISVDLDIDSEKIEASLCQSKVCQDRIQGADCGDEVGYWISNVLNRPGLRLIRQLPEDSRTHRTNAGELSLANQAQYLLINKKSVDWLSELLEETSDCSKESMLDRFRSNFVISGVSDSFIEQEWTQVKIGKTLFNVDGPCGRCQMICINQDTGEKSKEPLTTLAASMQGKLKFGIYLSKVSSENCIISINESVQVESWN